MGALWRRQAPPRRAFSLAARRTWLGILGRRRLAPKPARTPSACGLAKSALLWRFAPVFAKVMRKSGLPGAAPMRRGTPC